MEGNYFFAYELDILKVAEFVRIRTTHIFVHFCALKGIVLGPGSAAALRLWRTDVTGSRGYTPGY